MHYFSIAVTPSNHLILQKQKNVHIRISIAENAVRTPTSSMHRVAHRSANLVVKGFPRQRSHTRVLHAVLYPGAPDRLHEQDS